MFPFEQTLNDTEKTELIANHKTLEEGYITLYLKAEFEKRGYSVITDSQELRFNLPDGSRKVFDLIIEKNSERKLIIFDNGQMYEEDYYRSLDKTLSITKDICIITKDEDTLFQYSKRNCMMWITKHLGGMENARGKVIFHFSTLQWLITNEKLWEEMKI